MSKYILIHGQFHELPDNTLMHWKYIKREKVNGKWKYYYDLGETQKKNYEQAKKDYYSKVNELKRIRAKNVNGIETGIDHYSVANTKKKHALRDALKTAEYEYKTTPLYKREARAEKAKQNVAKVKNWAKDVAGYDEKQAMETAKTASNVAKNKAIDVESKNSKWKIKYTDFDPYTGEASKKPGYDVVEELADYQTNYYKDLAKKAESKYIDAIEEYKKTPLAKIEKASAKIDSVKERVAYMLKDLKKSRVPQPILSPEGTEKIITENVIREKTIPQNVIYEKTIPQNVIYEKRMTEDELREETAKKRKKKR
jgi:hypothetical protein